jgi:Arrestin (or S-antigen), N-terminal domain
MFGKTEFIDLFEIRLDKQQYKIGEEVKGTLVISSRSDLKERGIDLYAYRVERIRIVTVDRYGSHESEKKNISIIQDLREFLNPLRDDSISDNHIKITEGIKQIPFEFSIPYDTIGSYQGTDAWISYGVGAKLDRAWHRDVSADIKFDVLPSKVALLYYNREAAVFSNNKNGANISVELQYDKYFASEPIKGQLRINNTSNRKIRSASIILRAVEYVHAKFDHNVSKKDVQEKIIELATNEDKKIFQFEIQVPCFAISYKGTLFDCLWNLHTKIDIARSRDVSFDIPLEIV